MTDRAIRTLTEKLRASEAARDNQARTIERKNRENLRLNRALADAVAEIETLREQVAFITSNEAVQ